MRKLYSRETYLSRIRPFYYENEIIKVITGVRRCGKSSMMELIAKEIINNGVSEDSIVHINLDKRPYKNIKTPEQLENLLTEKLDSITGNKFLFVDEIQNVKNFEEVINAFREEDNCSIFITGSNSYLLSGELATKLTGRYLEFNIGTLSFFEYVEMKKFFKIDIDPNLDNEFEKYIIEGGFPYAIKLKEPSAKREYVNGVIDEIFKKDIKSNKKVRNKHLFDMIETYIINNFGAPTSVNSLCAALEKNGNKVNKKTIYSYLKVLEDAKIVYRCNRFDLKSKKSLFGDEKYYLTDLSFYFANHVDNRINYGPVLENIVYNYAFANNYAISVGRIGKLEIDFILRDELTNEYAYVQVAKTIDNGIYNERGLPATEEREYAPFEKIRDGYPRYLLTMDKLLQKRSGVKHENIINFMLNSKRFS